MHIHQPPSLTPIYPVTLRQLDPLAPSLFSLETKQCLARPCLPRATFTLLFLLTVSQPDSLTRCHPFFLSRSLSNSLACSTLSIPCTTPSLRTAECDTKSHAIWLAANISIGWTKTSRNKEGYAGKFSWDFDVTAREEIAKKDKERRRRAKKQGFSRRELGLCHRKRLGKFSVVHWSYWQKAKLEEIVHIMARGRRSMKVQERFRKERFSLGSHGLYGWIRNAEHFLARKMWPHPPIQMNRLRIRSRGEAETARENDSDVRFASRFIDALFRKWRAICRVPFGPRRHVISRMASASYSIRMFPLFRCHSARVSSLTHAFSDCTSLRRDSMRWIASAERAAVATCIMSWNLCSFSGSSNRTRYPLIFIETKVQKNSPLQRTDDESAMKFHYREMFVKRFRPSKVLFSA